MVFNLFTRRVNRVFDGDAETENRLVRIDPGIVGRLILTTLRLHRPWRRWLGLGKRCFLDLGLCQPARGFHFAPAPSSADSTRANNLRRGVFAFDIMVKTGQRGAGGQMAGPITPQQYRMPGASVSMWRIATLGRDLGGREDDHHIDPLLSLGRQLRPPRAGFLVGTWFDICSRF